MKTSAIEFTRSPGGKKVIFNDAQMDILFKMNADGLLVADGRRDKEALTKGRCSCVDDEARNAFFMMRSKGFPYVVLNDAEMTIRFCRLINIPSVSFRSKSNNIRVCTDRRSNDLCMHFHPHIFDVTVADKMNPKDGFNDDDVLSNIADRMVGRGRAVTMDRGRILSSICAHPKVRRTSIFSPVMAKTIYNRYCTDGMKILDPCAGFSSRLLGFLSSDLKDAMYVGIEPHPETFSGLQKTGEYFLNMARGNKAYELVNGCAEDVVSGDHFREGVFDVVFTSPPYYDLEDYGNHGDLSHVKFAFYEEWLDGFMFPVLKRSYDLLNDGGRLILAVSSVGKIDLPSHVKMFAAKNGFEEEEMFNLQYPSQWHSSFSEPLFVFRKPSR